LVAFFVQRRGLWNMKRQKRDRLERARARGYQAGVVGKNSESCPYQCLDARGHWLGGWRDAMEGRSSGLFMK
jgi:ribosome modulation factor